MDKMSLEELEIEAKKWEAERYFIPPEHKAEKLRLLKEDILSKPPTNLERLKELSLTHKVSPSFVLLIWDTILNQEFHPRRGKKPGNNGDSPNGSEPDAQCEGATYTSQILPNGGNVVEATTAAKSSLEEAIRDIPPGFLRKDTYHPIEVELIKLLAKVWKSGARDFDVFMAWLLSELPFNKERGVTRSPRGIRKFRHRRGVRVQALPSGRLAQKLKRQAQNGTTSSSFTSIQVPSGSCSTFL